MQQWIAIVVGAVIGGVALRSLFPVDVYVIGFLCVLAIAFFLYARSCGQPLVWCACVVCVALLVGVARMHIAIPEQIPLVHVGSQFVLEGEVVREPDVREGYTNLIIVTEELTHKVLVRVRSPQTFHYKDTIRAQGVLARPENFEGDTGRVFDYQGYLVKDGVYYILETHDTEVLSRTRTFRGELLEAKALYLSSLARYLREPYAALAGGITVGERRSLGDVLTEKFRDAGLIHIVVLSGYNITIIVIALMYLLTFLPKRIAALISIGAIIIFTLIVGASATVVRAALMGTIAALGIFFRQSYNALYALCIAGLLMVLWNPYVVLYDPSFQLSFIATLGLLLGAPLLVDRLRFIPHGWGMRELVAVTFATQIAVLPLLVYMMGVVSFVALPVNVAALPAVPLAMLLVFLTGVLGMMTPVVAVPFAFGAELLLSYITHVVTLSTSFSFATITVPNVSFMWVMVVYVLLGLLWWKLSEGRKESLDWKT